MTDWVSKKVVPSVLTWLGQQGVSTVLLFSLVWMAWTAGPQLAEGLTNHVDRVTASHERQVSAIAEAFSADQDRDQEVLEKIIDAKRMAAERGADHFADQ